MNLCGVNAGAKGLSHIVSDFRDNFCTFLVATKEGNSRDQVVFGQPIRSAAAPTKSFRQCATQAAQPMLRVPWRVCGKP